MNTATLNRSKTLRLTSRGVAVVSVIAALAAAGVAALAMNGHLGVAALIALTAYMLFGGGAARVAKHLPSQIQLLRAVCWTVAGTAAVIAMSPTTAPGGATLGVALAAATATALHVTRNASRRK
jgi:hypothetical protein